MGLSPLRFVWTLPDELLCPVCKGVLDDAVYVDTCQDQHPVCPACLQKRLATPQGLSCPVCSDSVEGTSIFIASDTRKVVGEHLIRCVESRCSWVGPQHSEQDHKSACEFRQIPCAFCHQVLPHDDMFVHLQNCAEATVQCGYGGKDCGGKDRGVFRRNESELHTLFCTNLPCSTPGCKTRSTLANIREHQTQCLEVRRYIFRLEHTSKIHHSNASLLATFVHRLADSPVISTIEGGSQWVKLAKTLYPDPLKYGGENDGTLGALPSGVSVKSIQPTPIDPTPAPSDPLPPASSSSSTPATLEPAGQDKKPRSVRAGKATKPAQKEGTAKKGTVKEEENVSSAKKRKLRSSSQGQS
ncbi:hypothetical protein JCM5353_008652 [Sporobolomyces roseus]